MELHTTSPIFVDKFGHVMKVIQFFCRPAFTSIESNELFCYVHSILESCALVHLTNMILWSDHFMAFMVLQDRMIGSSCWWDRTFLSDSLMELGGTFQKFQAARDRGHEGIISRIFGYARFRLIWTCRCVLLGTWKKNAVDTASQHRAGLVCCTQWQSPSAWAFRELLSGKWEHEIVIIQSSTPAADSLAVLFFKPVIFSPLIWPCIAGRSWRKVRIIVVWVNNLSGSSWYPAMWFNIFELWLICLWLWLRSLKFNIWDRKGWGHMVCFCSGVFIIQFVEGCGSVWATQELSSDPHWVTRS